MRFLNKDQFQSTPGTEERHSETSACSKPSTHQVFSRDFESCISEDEVEDECVMVQLHPLHAPQGGHGPVRLPLTPSQTAEDILNHWIQQDLVGKRVAFVVSNGTLEQEPSRDAEGTWEELCPHIDLVCATAVCGRYTRPELKGTSLIVIVPAVEADSGDEFCCWLFTCPWSNTQTAMSALGAAGCVRMDISQRYDLGQHALGSGNYGFVFCAQDRATQDWVAVKRLKSDQSLKRVQNEVRMLVLAQGHPNIVFFRGLYRSEDEFSSHRWDMVFDYYPLGDLYEHVVRLGAMEEKQAKPKMYGLVSALAFLSGRNMFHRDIKPENILLTNTGDVVLTDFGIATHLDHVEEMKHRRGSVGYAAPEMIESRCTSSKGDVFGAGVVLYFMLTQQVPFMGATAQIVARRTVRCHFSPVHPRLANVSQECKDLLTKLICKEEVRLSASEALDHVALRSAGRTPSRSKTPSQYFSPLNMSPAQSQDLPGRQELLAVQPAEPSPSRKGRARPLQTHLRHWLNERGQQ